MERPLNIAHCVASYHPSVGGMQEVVKQLSERMVKMGHQVTVFTSNDPLRDFSDWNGVRVKGFSVRGDPVVGNHGDTESYWQAVKNGNFDIVTLFAAQQWSADIVLQHADELKAKKVFVPTGFSQLHSPLFTGYFKRMPGWMRKMDLNIFLSDTYQDIGFARKHGIEAITVIPNGAAEEEFSAPMHIDLRAQHGIRRDQNILVHVGSFTGIKGHEEAVRIFLEAEIGDAVLMFVGSDIDRFEERYRKEFKFMRLRWKQERRNKRILFLKLDREATVAAMRQADLFFFPSRVECSPIVLFEAMAAGIPFLSSNAGNSAEISRYSKAGWILPGNKDKNGWEMIDIKEGARMLEKLLADPEKLKQAGHTGRSVWKHGFTWQHITEMYLKEYQRLVNG